MTIVQFIVAPGVHLLDLSGPAQVFSHAADRGADYVLRYAGDTERVPTAQGIDVHTGTGLADPGPDDIVLVPGWASRFPGAGALSGRLLAVLRTHQEAGGTLASVCSGADALGRAGVLDGRRCTTHHTLQDGLAARFPRASVVRDVLFVQDGNVITSAGIASGIDLALHLLEQRSGQTVAAQVAREMVVYARRNGREAQLSVLLAHRSHLDDVVHRAQDAIDGALEHPLSLDALARHCLVSPRTLTRRFVAATGMTPQAYRRLARLERAERLIAAGAGMERAARAVGFTDARTLRRLRAQAREEADAPEDGEPALP
ncbi:GlxA family transcriptional regulator [Nocardiopsis composta]|uniref:Transcriptional regulator GlxA family with amidase domain n=1 Tax=Nocardiopsis composta TaxID=157465 RepID=A0A7W8QIP3_9ACTN|nr:DJ-1/PfpI family protein [Nocardiopsis composta]MBB5430425.1 transcriptional regulator GlxA family with amidase domain [Nocardiopsis composta]